MAFEGFALRNADLKSAVSQNCILRMRVNDVAPDVLGWAADCKSAIQQSATLRYAKNFCGAALMAPCYRHRFPDIMVILEELYAA